MSSSIFSYNTDANPSRVSSPWRNSTDNSGNQTEEDDSEAKNDPDRLEAEPQDGPIEYKLHLLLRPRRRYEVMSTTSRVAGSQQAKQARPVKSLKPNSAAHPVSSQTRQSRLQQLTTQLLWRLQQSAPFHGTAKVELVIPKLPENSGLELLEKPQPLLPGLDESNGALYEIGVSDDGTFVGVTKDEMDESMTTLKIMAATLGCRVEVQRMKCVGHCEWAEVDNHTLSEIHHSGDLWVAEALVMPILKPQKDVEDENAQLPHNETAATSSKSGASQAEQLRVSMIGPTTSGKTTLLGTLANGTLDNGRGSSRINLLRHRHELVSGQTSSVAQELIGYKDDQIFNYAANHVKTWTDIHDYSRDGRLVFFSDSAGHLRFRRTIMRGLVGWAPHWTLLCITANGGAIPSQGVHSLSGKTDDLGDMVDSMGLALSHLDLCLKLEIPLVIVITKYDQVTTSKTLKDTLSPVLSKIKACVRTPKLLAPSQPGDADLTHIPSDVQVKVTKDITDGLSGPAGLLSIVPVVLTSAATGVGISQIHALLRNLPMPPAPTAQDFTGQVLNPEQPIALFHIDDKYKWESRRTQDTSKSKTTDNAIVVAGYLRFGRLSVGDRVVLGPFPAELDESRGSMPRDHPSPGQGLSISHPFASRNAVSASAIQGEWHNATVVNIRNLRLPVRTMETGQAGTIQVVFDNLDQDNGGAESLMEKLKPKPMDITIRKGQVLAIPSQQMMNSGLTLQAATGFTATFTDPKVSSLTHGTLVNAYIATIRAAARVTRVVRQRVGDEGVFDVSADDGDFGAQDEFETEVSLELLTNREWIELGSKVVVMEGGGGHAALEGYVGKVVEVVE